MRDPIRPDNADGLPAYSPFFESQPEDGAAALRMAMAERGYLRLS